MKKIQILYADPFIREDVVYKLLCEKYKLEAISIANVIREEIQSKTDLGLEISAHFNKGELLPSKLVKSLVHQQVTSTNKGILLRSFPAIPELFHDFVNQLGSLKATVDKVWHFELVSPEYEIKKFQAHHDPDNKYETTPSYILEKFNARRDILQSIVNLWKSDFDVQCIKVDTENDGDVSAYYEKVLAEHG